MKKILLIVSFLFYFFCLFAQKSNLFISLENIKPKTGKIFIAVHNKSNFLKESFYATQIIDAQSTTQKVEFFLPKGDYAVAVYQDFNSNKKMDKNRVGVPQEPYGFSNNIRPRFRAPTYDETKFFIGETNLNLSIKLESW